MAPPHFPPAARPARPPLREGASGPAVRRALPPPEVGQRVPPRRARRGSARHRQWPRRSWPHAKAAPATRDVVAESPFNPLDAISAERPADKRKSPQAGADALRRVP
ncbi:MAG: hypothetical protein EXQ88_06710 [Alphaproteobacteria bacterium]|nr:hypothetical protein [Alphaproteobacteria bacterium]